MRRRIAVVCLVGLMAFLVMAVIFKVRSYSRTRVGNTARILELKHAVDVKCGDLLVTTLIEQFRVDPDEGMSYINGAENRRLSALLMQVLAEWVDTGFESWTDVDDAKSMVFLLLHSGSSLDTLGRAAVLTDDDLAIAEKATERFNEEYPRLGSKIVLWMRDDGAFVCGVRNSYH